MIRLATALATGAAFSLLGVTPLASAAGPVYSNCDEAHAAGVFDIPADDPAYWDDGDRDDDGFACDSPAN